MPNKGFADIVMTFTQAKVYFDLFLLLKIDPKKKKVRWGGAWSFDIAVDKLKLN